MKIINNPVLTVLTNEPLELHSVMACPKAVKGLQIVSQKEFIKMKDVYTTECVLLSSKLNIF